MSETNREEPSRKDESSSCGPNPFLLLFPMMAFEMGRLALEGFVAGLALLGNYRVRWIDITFGPLLKSQPEKEKEVS